MASTSGMYYDAYMDYYKRAVAAQKSGQNETARKMFILAAENLQKLALESQGELRRSRYEMVKKLLLAAESVGNQTLKNDGSPPPRGQGGGAAPGDFPLDITDVKNMKNKVAFDDIIGLDEAKISIHRRLINPLKHPDTYGRYKRQAGGNILLEGPPGTGKTTFAKAAASEIGMPFININCTSLVDALIGATGKNIVAMFAAVRNYIKTQNTAVILFFDEFDAIAKSRDSDDKTAHEAVPTLIAQLDGFDTDNTNLAIIAATNLKGLLDKAIISRFKPIYIPLPNESDRAKMFALKINKFELDAHDMEGLDYATLARASEGLSGRDINHVVEELIDMLAERDAGFTVLENTTQELLLYLLKSRQRQMARK